MKNNRLERKGRIIDFSQNLFTKIMFFQWFIFEKVMFSLNFDLYDGDLRLSWWKQQIAEMMKTKKSNLYFMGIGLFSKIGSWITKNLKWNLPYLSLATLLCSIKFFFLDGRFSINPPSVLPWNTITRIMSDISAAVTVLTVTLSFKIEFLKCCV